MQLKTLKIGRHTIGGNAFLAPLAGYTDFAFRALCLGQGAALTYTEMVSAKGLVYGSEKTEELLYLAPEETICACQIFGSEPDVMRRAIESPALAPFDIIDINMGCPVPKLYKNGEGSALLCNPQLAEKIVAECVKTGKTVTVKMRIGTKDSTTPPDEFARRMEGAGAQAITVHGRYREAYYNGEPDYNAIKSVKRAVAVPVLANGGIFSMADADNMIHQTGADGVMIARGALGNPWIFGEIYGKTVRKDKYTAIITQAERLMEKFDQRHTIVNLRKAVAWYLKGERGGKEIKEKVFRAETLQELKTALLPIKK